MTIEEIWKEYNANVCFITKFMIEKRGVTLHLSEYVGNVITDGYGLDKRIKQKLHISIINWTTQLLLELQID